MPPNTASDIRLAVVPGFILRIGARAASVPDSAAAVYGVVMKLSDADLERLYSEPNLLAYRPEPVLAKLQDLAVVAALFSNLPETPSPEERNAEYGETLRILARRVGLPGDHVASTR